MKIIFYGLALAAVLQRLWEMKYYPRQKGRVYASWTLKGMILSHTIFLLGAPVEWTLRDHPFSLPVVLTGAVVFLAGTSIRLWVQATLKEFWSVQIEIREDHPLCTGGPYRFCRHPNYLGILLEDAGYCLFFHAFFTGAVSLALCYTAIRFRMKIEEEAMHEKFPEDYKTFCATRLRLLPFGMKRGQP